MEFKYKKRFKEAFNYLKALLPKDEWHFHEFEIDGETVEGLDKVFEKYPQLTDDDEYLKLFIELETGHVVNWPTEFGEFDFHDAKIVDGGIYTLMKSTEPNENDLGYDGYVPDCLGHGGWGDYLEFEVDANGNIKDWEFTNDDYKQFLHEQLDWDEDDD